MYAVEFAPGVMDDILGLRLDRQTREWLLKNIRSRLSQSPCSYGTALRSRLSGFRRIRISQFRVIYAVRSDARVVVVCAVGNRRGIYKDFGREILEARLARHNMPDA